MEYFSLVMSYVVLSSSVALLLTLITKKFLQVYLQLNINMNECPYDNALIKFIWGFVRFNFTPKFSVESNIDLTQLNGQPFVVVANHQCGSDPAFLLYSVSQLPGHRKLSFLSTDYYNERVPGIRGLLDSAETIYVPYKNRTRAAIINQALVKLKQGVCVALFPFGSFHTYKHETRAVEIKTGAAEIAIKARVPIVVISINNIRPKLFEHVFRSIGYYIIHGVSDVEIKVDKIITPDEFPVTSKEHVNYALLSNIIESFISKQYHQQPGFDKNLVVNRLTVDKITYDSAIIDNKEQSAVTIGSRQAVNSLVLHSNSLMRGFSSLEAVEDLSKVFDPEHNVDLINNNLESRKEKPVFLRAI